MKLICGVCKGIAFKSLHINAEKAVEEVLLKFGQHLQSKHVDVVKQLTLDQHRCTGLFGTIMLADQLEKDESDSDNDRFSSVIEKGVNGLLQALGVEYENESDNNKDTSNIVAIDESISKDPQ